MAMLKALRQRADRRAIVQRLSDAISERARAPVFFTEFEVADTMDGRFDVLSLHAWLVLEELQRRRQGELVQHLMNLLFVQFDEALRELGAGDVGMGRRMKKFASAFYGRLEAYGGASDEGTLAQAISRNLYRGAERGLEPAKSLASYCSMARDFLARAGLEAGEVNFGPVPLRGTRS